MHRVVVSFFLGALVVLGTAAVASAADMRVKAPVYKAPQTAAGYNWTGCYIGGNIGYGWQRTTSTDVEPNAPPPFELGAETGTGAVGGGQVGCDYQVASSWVLGIQGMFDGAGVHGSHIVPFSFAGNNDDTWTTKTDWFATLTGRIGYAVLPQALLYFKGGAAWVKSKYSDVDPSGFPYHPFSGQATATRVGWTVGGGAEYILQPNLSVFVEYNYADLGSKTVGLAYSCTGACSFASPYRYSEKQNLQTVLIGLNYRFDGGRSLVSAKY